MGLEKAIEHGKEHRKPYIGAKAVDCSCRNHGTCDYCKENRLFQRTKVEEAADVDIKEFEQSGDNGD